MIHKIESDELEEVGDYIENERPNMDFHFIKTGFGEL